MNSVDVAVNILVDKTCEHCLWGENKHPGYNCVKEERTLGNKYGTCPSWMTLYDYTSSLFKKNESE